MKFFSGAESDESGVGSLYRSASLTSLSFARRFEFETIQKVRAAKKSRDTLEASVFAVVSDQNRISCNEQRNPKGYIESLKEISVHDIRRIKPQLKMDGYCRQVEETEFQDKIAIGADSNDRDDG